MANAIRALRPRLVLIENVPGLASKMGVRPGESALGTVIADLAEATGYDFSDYEKSDPLARGPEEAVDNMPRFVPLESPDDLVL